jgi:hypothetical protein
MMMMMMMMMMKKKKEEEVFISAAREECRTSSVKSGLWGCYILRPLLRVFTWRDVPGVSFLYFIYFIRSI